MFACKNDLDEVKALNEKKTSVETGYRIQSFLSEGAKVKAKLSAPLMLRYQTDTPYVEFPKTLHVDFYNDSARVESRLDTRYGKYKESEQKVFLKDSVVISNLQGDTLWCRELWWDQQLQQFYTDKPVRIRKPGEMYYGRGLKADQSLKWYNLDTVTGIMQVPRETLQ